MYVLVLFLTVATVPAWIVAGCAVARLIDAVTERRRPRLGALILMGIGGLLLVVAIVLAVLAGKFNLHLYWLGTGLHEWMLYICAFMAFFLLFGCLLVAVRKVLSFKTLIFGVLLGGGMLVVLFGVFLARGDAVYTEISSPPSAGPVHELVVEEKSWFMIGEGVVYEKVSPCFMRRLDDYVLDDGFRPMYYGLCDFEWYEDGFIIECQPDEKIKYAP